MLDIVTYVLAQEAAAAESSTTCGRHQREPKDDEEARDLEDRTSMGA